MQDACYLRQEGCFILPVFLFVCVSVNNFTQKLLMGSLGNFTKDAYFQVL